MEVCLINFDKGEDDEGCLKFCNILKSSANFKQMWETNPFPALKGNNSRITYNFSHKCTQWYIAYRSELHEFTPVFIGIRVALVFCVKFCTSNYGCKLPP